MIFDELGLISDGLIIAQFPDAIAFANGLRVTKYGKFHEPYMRATPRGSYLILVELGKKISAGSKYTSLI